MGLDTGMNHLHIAFNEPHLWLTEMLIPGLGNGDVHSGRKKGWIYDLYCNISTL